MGMNRRTRYKELVRYGKIESDTQYNDEKRGVFIRVTFWHYQDVDYVSVSVNGDVVFCEKTGSLDYDTD